MSVFLNETFRQKKTKFCKKRLIPFSCCCNGYYNLKHYARAKFTMENVYEYLGDFFKISKFYKREKYIILS